MPKLVDVAMARFHHVIPIMPPEMEAVLASCIDAQRRSLIPRPGGQADVVEFRPDPDPERHVSEEALLGILAAQRDVSDVRTDPALSNCLVFHTGGLPGSVHDTDVVDARREIDGLVTSLLRACVDGIVVAGVRASGHFWYPPGSYMGWHTNSRVSGWRAYLTWVTEPERSFFRYAQTDSGGAVEIVTSWDTGWDLRLFRVDAHDHFWHSVCSHADRFSFGYQILEP